MTPDKDEQGILICDLPNIIFTQNKEKPTTSSQL